MEVVLLRYPDAKVEFMGFRRFVGLTMCAFIVGSWGYTQSVWTSNLEDARKLLEIADGKPYNESIDIDSLDEINQIFKLPNEAQVVLTREQYFHVGRVDIEFFIEIPGPEAGQTPEHFLKDMSEVGWMIYGEKDDETGQWWQVCLADHDRNLVYDGFIQKFYSGNSWSEPAEYKTWMRFTDSTGYPAFFPTLWPPAPCYEGIPPTRKAFIGTPQLEEGSTVCSYLTLDVDGPSNFEPFVYSVLLPSPEIPVAYDSGECWWQANEVKVYNTILPHDIIIKISAKDRATANDIWYKILSYRCLSSDNKMLKIPLGDDACWQKDSSVMSGGFEVLYTRYQLDIYMVAINPYLEEDSFHLAVKLTLQTMNRD